MDQKPVIDSLLTRLVERLRTRDVEGVVELFEEDATLYGSEEGESARGHDGLREFLGGIFRRPHTYGWNWDAITTDADGAVLWFVAPATVVVRQDDGSERSAPYRLSGVLRCGPDGQWRFALFNGSEPAAPA